MSIWSDRRERAQARRLATAIRDTLCTPEAVELCGPTALRLLWATSEHLWHIHGVMCWLALRWSEVPSIRVQALRIGRRAIVATTKGGRPRSLDVSIAARVRSWSNVDALAIPITASYDSVAMDLLSAMGRADIVPVAGMQCVTHAWRHLRAEHMHAHGAPIEVIGHYLGHRSIQSTRAYIPVGRPGLTPEHTEGA